MNAQDTLWQRLESAANHYEGMPLYEMFVADLRAAAQIVKDTDTLRTLVQQQGAMIVELEARIKRAVDQRDTP
jgi:hypothetical protein